MEHVIELVSCETYNCCALDLNTGQITELYSGNEKLIKGFTGFFFADGDTFFALYPTETGPMIYYKGKSYPLHKGLNIELKKSKNWREFSVEEYDIKIGYRTPQYIGFDIWSDEIDVDLFYKIEQSYKDDEFYNRLTEPTGFVDEFIVYYDESE